MFYLKLVTPTLECGLMKNLVGRRESNELVDFTEEITYFSESISLSKNVLKHLHINSGLTIRDAVQILQIK
jgi:hypothetical protein